ncbi:Coactosin [Tritrichomonas foetus]|uniref:Coactosin n=1 Tax=Tritrichomonas foetus TaxID=1144522 RepID=A0A1J4KDH9_9EUKA|nr:Coactosin [Tritrichomonas foetus]|eukprot:OHT09489.1 Coactosin [Tritrichomonas foetus]
MADVSAPEIKEAYDEIRSEKETDWVFVKPSDGNPNKWVLHAKGSDGVAGLAASLDESILGYGYLRVKDGAGRTKFIFLQYVGPNAKRTVSIRMNMQKADVQNVLSGQHAFFETTELSELTEANVMQKIVAH